MNSYQQKLNPPENGSEESKDNLGEPLDGTYQGDSNMFTSAKSSSDEKIHYISVAQEKKQNVSNLNAKNPIMVHNSPNLDDIDESSITNKPGNSNDGTKFENNELEFQNLNSLKGSEPRDTPSAFADKEQEHVSLTLSISDNTEVRKNNSVLDDLSLDIATDSQKLTKFTSSTHRNNDYTEINFKKEARIPENTGIKNFISSEKKCSFADSHSTANFKMESSDQKAKKNEDHSLFTRVKNFRPDSNVPILLGNVDTKAFNKHSTQRNQFIKEDMRESQEEFTSFEKLIGQKAQLIPPSSDSSTTCIPERVTISDFEGQAPVEYARPYQEKSSLKNLNEQIYERLLRDSESIRQKVNSTARDTKIQPYRKGMYSHQRANSEQNFENLKIEDKLMQKSIQSQKRFEILRKTYEVKEQRKCRNKPLINSKTHEITRDSKALQQRQIDHLHKKKVDLEIKRKEEEHKAMKECTGKPKINERSKRIKMSNISQLVKPRANNHNLCKGKKFKRTKNNSSSKRKPPTGRNTPNGVTLIESPGRVQPAVEITPRSILCTPQSDYLDGFAQNDGQLSMNCTSNQHFLKEGEESLVQYAKSPNPKPKKVSFGFVRCSSTPQIEVKSVNTIQNDRQMFYEPLHHKVDRVFFEACELKRYDPSQINFTTSRHKKVRVQTNIENKENENSCQISPNRCKTSRQGSMTSMIINGKLNNDPVIQVPRGQSKKADRVLTRNNIRPRNPSFSAKCLSGYVESGAPLKSRELATEMNSTCARVLKDPRVYLKKPKEGCHWGNKLNGKNFLERGKVWTWKRDLKIKQSAEAQRRDEVHDCTFKPDVKPKKSPSRGRNSIRSYKTTRNSPSREKMGKKVLLNSPLSNSTTGDLGTSYSSQYAKKCKYRKSQSKKRTQRSRC
ncbi:unnamed protein product [Moneuplotes crassus]|uniref:Uncharacterized protein n=1 Tax=Euplotes crassus TaxID=5936 RepID=A0AAD1XIE9_EUPCR|nr:unnamed protein product [Moneuplotes crassus]